MSEDRIQIASDRGPNDDIEPLEAVLDYCVALGLDVSNSDSGYFNKEKKGKYCSVRGNITANDLQMVFNFPRHVTIESTQTSGEIRDWKHKTRIYFLNRDKVADNRAMIERWTGGVSAQKDTRQ